MGWPVCVIGRRKTVVGHHGAGQKEGMYQAVGAVVHPRVPHLPGGDGDNDGGGTEKEFHLRAAPNRFQRTARDDDIPEGKVKRGKQ